MPRPFARLSLIFSLTGGLLSGQPAIYTGQYNAARTSANQAETVLNTSNVNGGQFGLLFSRQVDAQIYAQPLYVPGVAMAGGARNVVYAATMNNTVYAFDADNPGASAPLWSVNLGPPMPIAQAKLSPQVGILSTPVIDPATATLYAVAATLESGSYYYRLHALDIASGAEKFGGPVTIRASVRGTAPDAVAGIVTFNPAAILQRPALLLAGGVIHIAFGTSNYNPGHLPYHGWLMGYNASTLAQTYVLNTTPNGSNGGIWMSAAGPSADANAIYVAVGNGDTGGGNLGETVLRLGAKVDYFTPANFQVLNYLDWDMGSSGAVLLPGTNLLAAGGKIGVLFLLSRTNLGQYQPNNQGAAQKFQLTPGCSAPVYNGCAEIHHLTYWYRGSGDSRLFVWGWNDFLKAFVMTNGVLNTTPASTNSAVAGYPGGILALSSNGAAAGTAIVWAVTAAESYIGDGLAQGVLRAYDAMDVSHELWNSAANPADALGLLAKFAPPVVANGRVYVATASNALQVYGLK
ncbi:MAG TPA: PQQ-binding-like beta-propeller repeat protein [Bryobacteraceae bacterium]|nr:PQQ-binding-like beta-propeller repeat protein [Bryobacteraceae bacterium]